MDKYVVEIVMESEHYVHFYFYVNNVLTTPNQPISMKKDEFDRFYKVMFRGSKGNCVRVYSTNPPTQFYP